MAAELSSQVCARKGCKKRVPLVAWRAGDLHCSTGCFRVDHGLMDAEKVRADVVASERARAGGGSCEMRFRNSIRWEQTRGKKKATAS